MKGVGNSGAGDDCIHHPPAQKVGGGYIPPLYPPPPPPGSPPMAQWLLLKLSILHTNYIPSDTNSGNSQAKCMCLITELCVIFK